MKVRPRNSTCTPTPFNTGIAFTELSDTPDSYLGQSGKIVTVNEDEDGLEFTDPSPGLTFSDWDASTNLFPTGATLGDFFHATTDATTLVDENGNLITAGSAITPRVSNPGQSLSDWQIFLDYNDYLGSDSVSNFLGVVLNKITFPDLSGYATRGATVVPNAGKLDFSLGAGDFDQSLDYTITSGVQNFIRRTVITANTKNGTSYGFSSGRRSTNTYVPNSIWAFFNMTSGAGGGILSIVVKNGASETYVFNSDALSFSAGDNIELIISFRNNKFEAWIRNLSVLNGNFIYAPYEFTSYTGTTLALPNTGTISIGNQGGSFSMVSDHIFIAEPTKGNLLVTDSKGFYFPTQFSETYPNLLRSNYDKIIVTGGPADRIVEFAARRAEITALDPDVILLAIGSNDVREGRSSVTYLAEYDAEVAYYIGLGKIVYHIRPFYETVLNQTPMSNHLDSTYPNFIIENSITPSYLDSDGVHINNSGHESIYRDILMKGVLTNAISALRQEPYFKSWTPVWVGFSASPVVVARFILRGKQLFFRIHTTTPGTSGGGSSTLLTFTLPDGLTSCYLAPQHGEINTLVDNGAAPTTLGYWTTPINSNVVECYKNNGGAAWTGSGSKAVYLSGMIEVN